MRNLENYKDRLWIVAGQDHYSPLGTIRSLGELGIYPDYISVGYKARVASKSKYISSLHVVEEPEEVYFLLKNHYSVLHLPKKPILIITDDHTMQCIDNHYSDLKDHFLMFNGGSDGRITEFMDKQNILDVASRHGINVLKTNVYDKKEIASGGEPKDLPGYPVITKSISPNVGGWKSDVHICNNVEELIEACKSIKSPKVLIQRFIDKKNERCLDGYTYNEGRDLFISIDSHYMYNIKGYYSPYHDVKNFTDWDIYEKLRSMFSEIGFEGIFSLEFIIDQDGTEYFSEVNFRQSTWSRCSSLCGMNLSIMWADSMETGLPPVGKDIKNIPKGFTAMTEPIDYNKRVFERGMNLFDWLSDFKNANCTYYWDKEDTEPWNEMVRNLDILM